MIKLGQLNRYTTARQIHELILCVFLIYCHAILADRGIETTYILINKKYGIKKLWQSLKCIVLRITVEC